MCTFAWRGALKLPFFHIDRDGVECAKTNVERDGHLSLPNQVAAASRIWSQVHWPSVARALAGVLPSGDCASLALAHLCVQLEERLPVYIA